jgi:prevent-host-death family protein
MRALARHSRLVFLLFIRYNVLKQVILTHSRSKEMEDVSVGEAKSRFSELISRATGGERFLIRRRNRPVAVLIGATELERLERMSQVTSRLALVLGQDPELLRQVEAQEVHPIMAAFGLWRDEEELATLTDEIYANRRRQGSRDGLQL